MNDENSMPLEPISAALPATLKALENPSLRWLIFPRFMKKALLNQKISEFEVEQAIQQLREQQSKDSQFLEMLDSFPPERAGLTERAHASFAAQAIDSQMNREAIAAQACTLLEGQEYDSAFRLDSDFIKRFYNYAGEVTKEEAQNTWAKLLAGEIKQPGSFSLKTLDILRVVTKKQAESIVYLSQYILGTGILLPYAMERKTVLTIDDGTPIARSNEEPIPYFYEFDDAINSIYFLGLVLSKKDYEKQVIYPKKENVIRLNSGSIRIEFDRYSPLYCFCLPLSDEYFELLSLQEDLPVNSNFISNIVLEIGSRSHRIDAKLFSGSGVVTELKPKAQHIVQCKYFFCST